MYKILISLLIFHQLFAQDLISEAEYYIGSDPGEGNGISLSTVDGTFDSGTEDLNIQIDSDILGLGVHRIFVRFKDDAGYWGQSKAVTVTVSNTQVGNYVTEAEYFIDSDPGVGHGLQIQSVDGHFDESVEELIANIEFDTDVSIGQHSISVRGKSSNGTWGQIQSTTIEIVESRAWFVSADGSDTEGDGSASAPFSSIQHAIDVSLSVDSVLVGSGVYYENINFLGKNIVVGSLFTITGDSMDVQETIIDGGEILPTVVLASGEDSTTVLIGFTIINGLDAGIYCEGSNPVIQSCVLDQTHGLSRSGIHCVDASPVIGSVIIQNSQGAGILLENDSNPTVNHSEIKNGFGTGIICSQSCDATLNNVIISGNNTEWAGGGFYAASSNPTLNNVTISNNSSPQGGGIFLSSSSLIGDSLFIQGNSSTFDGGGISVSYGASMELRHSIIASNTTNGVGNGIHGQGSQSSIINCTLFNNDVNLYGESDNPTSIQFTNSILWGSTVNMGEYNEMEVSYSLLGGGIEGIQGDVSGLTYIDVLDANPLFQSVGNADFSLMGDSPCIDVGDPDLDGDSNAWDIDLDDQDPDGTRLDIGALYFHQQPPYSGPTWYVSTGGSDLLGDGSVYAPFASIQQGIEYSIDGDTVLVLPGTYLESINYSGKNIVLGSQFLVTGDTTLIQQTVINAGEASHGVEFSNNEDTSAVLSGFTVLNGATQGIFCENSSPTINNCIVSQTLAHSRRGIWCWTSSPRINKVLVTGNNDIGIFVGYDSHPLITNSIISNNLNCGIHCDQYSSPTILDTHIEGNSGGASGGGIFAGIGCNPTIKRVTIRDNSTSQGGGGVYVGISSHVTMDSVIITGNSSSTLGGGLYVASEQSSISLNTSVISNNTSNGNAGNYYGTQRTSAQFINCTIIGGGFYLAGGATGTTSAYFLNSIIQSSSIHVEQRAEVSINYSLLQGGAAGVTGSVENSSFSFVIDEDPLFVNLENQVFHLTENSPCIDAGDPTSPLDPDGTRADMGAFYFDQNESWGDAPDRLWTRTSGSTDNDSPVHIIQSASSTEVVVLSKYRATDTQSDVIMMEKYNLVGDRLWTQFYDDTPNLTPTAVTLTDEDGYYILFYSSEAGGTRNIGLMKTDGDGNEIWRLFYVFDDYDSPRDLIRSNGELVILYEGALGVSVIGLDLDGQILWTKYHSYFPDAARIIATSDSGFAIVGTVGDDDRDAYLLKLDPEGEEEWRQIYIASGHQDGNDVVQLDDESLVFCGYSQDQDSGNYAGWLHKVDPSGDTIWERLFPTGGHKVFRAMCPTNDGGFALVGVIPFDEIGVQTIVVKTDTEGSLEWETGGLFQIHNWGVDLIETADRGFIAVGQVAVDGGNNDLDIWVARFEGEMDIISPEVQLNIPDITEAIHFGDTLTITWTASDNIALDWAKLFFTSNGGESFSLYDSVDANLGEIEWIAPDVLSNNCNFAIWVSDIAGNVSADTLNGSFSIADETPPAITILNPTDITSVKEGDTLVVSWDVSDNIGIYQLEFYYSNNPAVPFLYSSYPEVTDSTFSMPIGHGVSDSARVKMIAIDVGGNIAEDISEYFSITDNTSPVISHFSIPDTSVFGIGSRMDIQISATDNVQVTGLDLNYSIDAGATWIPITQDLFPVAGRPTHSWLIPDIPGDCQIQAVINDAVGLTDTAYSATFSVIIEYPQLVAQLPQIKPSMDMQLRFSQSMGLSEITTGTHVTGTVGGEYELDIEINGQDVFLSAVNGFVSLDTLMLVLSATDWTNSFGYGLDGNGNGSFEGSPDDNDTSFVMVSAAGDFDQNGMLDFDDFDDFVLAWTNEVPEYELYPHQGTVPFINIQPDSSFDVFDLATFASMWNWLAGISLSAPLTETYPVEKFVSEQVGNMLSVDLDYDGLIATQTIVKYDPGLVSISIGNQSLNKVSASGLSIVNTNPDSGFIMITSSHIDGEQQESLQLQLAPTTKHMYSIEVAVQGSSEQSEAIQKKSNIEVLPIPTTFSLSQNYPNPFNASTTIEYGLPKNTDMSISIYDIRGRFVKEIFAGNRVAGYHFTQWNGDNDHGQNVASGLYFIVLNTPEYRVAKKALILK